MIATLYTASTTAHPTEMRGGGERDRDRGSRPDCSCRSPHSYKILTDYIMTDIHPCYYIDIINKIFEWYDIV